MVSVVISTMIWSNIGESTGQGLQNEMNFPVGIEQDDIDAGAKLVRSRALSQLVRPLWLAMLCSDVI